MPEPAPATVADYVAQICSTAEDALFTSMSEGSVSNIGEEVEYIRQLNLQHAEAGGLFSAVWDLASAWDNAVALDGEPDLGPAANGNVVIMLENLVAYCRE
jgi:hypothetical protein